MLGLLQIWSTEPIFTPCVIIPASTSNKMNDLLLIYLTQHKQHLVLPLYLASAVYFDDNQLQLHFDTEIETDLFLSINALKKFKIYRKEESIKDLHNT